MDNSQSFALQWVKVQPIVSGVIMGGIHDRHDAEDVLQDVAVTAARDFSQYDASRPFLPWVLTIARHRIADHYRKTNRSRRVLDDHTLEALSESACRLAPHVSDREVALDECMQNLPKRGRRILEMRYYFDMSADAIGSRVGLSSAAVFSAMHRLRVALGKCIDERLQDQGGSQ